MTESEDVQKLSLLGEELPVKVSDSDNAREAYSIVKEKLNSIRDQSNSPSNVQLALLCSLNLAGELLSTEKEAEKNQLSDSVIDRIKTLTDDINEVLSQND
ncbi:MAG: cell division protein ZapA [bacterium]